MRGQLGRETANFAPALPAPVPDVDNVFDFTVGTLHVCVLGVDREVTCWGSNEYRQSDPNASHYWNFAHSTVMGLPRLSKLVASSTTTCGVTDTTELRCWGSGSNWFVSGLRSIADVALRPQGGCTSNSEGEVLCWGVGSNPIFVNGEWITGYSQMPGPVQGLGRVRALSTNEYETCGIDESGQVWCWSGPSFAPASAGQTPWPARRIPIFT